MSESSDIVEKQEVPSGRKEHTTSKTAGLTPSTYENKAKLWKLF